MADGLEQVEIQWHPGFYGATEIELIANKGDLEFLREYNLSKEPIRMDLLIIRKLSDVKIKNEIGHIFKKYNVIEYKSPDDELSIDDYYKTVGYACLYKGLGETVNQIPADELTLSIFREGYPRELFSALRAAGLEIEEYGHGIYYISGQVLFDTQVVVTGQLDKETHRSLRVLSRKANEEDIRIFIEETSGLRNPGDRNNVDAVLQVSVSANKELYREIRRRNSVMCEALRELMNDEIEEEKRIAVEAATREIKEAAAIEVERAAKAAEKATKEAKEAAAIEVAKATKEAEKATKEAREAKKTAKETVLTDIRSLMENTKWTAEKAMTALNIPVAEHADYAARL